MIGKQILNYKIDSLIGTGGMGNVYLGIHIQLGRKVAIKMLHPRFFNNDALKSRFKNEAAAMSLLQHPNIVGLFDYVESDEGLFLIMEYVQGQELDVYIREVSGPIPNQKTMDLFSQILEGFNYAHQAGIVHRDIKPSNILLTSDGRIKILDFGIAKLLDADKTLTKTGTQMGTVLYMSPEQVKGEKVDLRTDIYSLGITLFQMITGNSPYSADVTEYEIYNQIVKEPLPKASTVYPDVSAKIEKAIEIATKKEKEERFNSCADFLDFLKEKEEVIKPAATIKVEIPIPQIKNPPPPTPFEEKKKSKMGWWILGLLLIGGASFGIYTIWNSEQNNNTLETDYYGNNEKGYVLISALNFRKTANSDNSRNIIAELGFGNQFTFNNNDRKETYKNNTTTIWRNARFNGEDGWLAVSVGGIPYVSDLGEKNDLEKLFFDSNNDNSEYSIMRMWAQLKLVDFLDSQDELGSYKINSFSEYQRENSNLNNVIRYKDRAYYNGSGSTPYSYMALLESNYSDNKKLVYIRANDSHSGKVIDYINVPSNIQGLYKYKTSDGNYIEGLDKYENEIGWIDIGRNSIEWKYYSNY